MGSPTANRKQFRHQYTKEQRFRRALAQFPGADALFPVILHSLDRYLQSTTDLSTMDTIVRDAFRIRPAITREMMSEWVANWKRTPAALKARFVPPEIRDLNSAQKLDMNVFGSVLKRQALEHPQPVRPQPPPQRKPYMRMPNMRMPTGPGGIHLPAEAAVVTSISPTGPDGEYYAYLGQSFTIRGQKFSTSNEANSVLLFQVVGDVAQPGLAITPASSSTDVLTVVAPNPLDLAPGQYMLQVAVAGKWPSELVTMFLYKPPAPPATISAVVPAEQRPGLLVTVDGTGFGENPIIWWQASDPANQEGAPYGTVATRVSDSQIQFHVPDRLLYFPGAYLISVSGDSQPPSNWAQFTALPFKYRVEFQKMTCIDESDPEWWGDDEIVTKWVIGCDDLAWSKGTGEYTGFSDNTQENYKDSDKVVFPIDGSGEVRHDLSIGTALFEWDAGDAKAASEALGAVADIAKNIPVVGDWISYALKVFGKLASWLGGDPDALGQKVVHWTAPELHQRTATGAGFSGDLEFLNDDDTGSYKLTYRVLRVD